MFLTIDYLVMAVTLYSAFSICILNCALQEIDMNELMTTLPGSPLRTVCRYFYVPLVLVSIEKGCDSGPTVCGSYRGRFERLSICGCNDRGSTSF